MMTNTGDTPRLARDLGLEAICMLVAGVICIAVAMMIDPGVWPAAVSSVAVAVVVFLAIGFWLRSTISGHEPKRAAATWMIASAARFVSVPAIGLVLVLGFQLNPVASLLPPFVVYLVALGLETTTARRRLLSATDARTQESLSLEAST